MGDVVISRVNRYSPAAAVTSFAHHEYPFSTLGPLHSHAHPHFIIYNAGEKLASMDILELQHIVGLCMGIPSHHALECLTQIQSIYRSWQIKAPTSFQRTLSTKRSRSDFENHGDGDEAGSEGRSFRTRGSTRPTSKQGDSGHGQAGAQGEPGVRHVASLSYSSDPPDLEMDESDSCCGSTTSVEDGKPCEDTGAGVTNISQWVEGAKGAASDGGWEPAVINDDQLGDYAEERARSPRTQPWHTWRASWVRRGLEDLAKPPPDTTGFSSNDWSLYDYCVLLTHAP